MNNLTNSKGRPLTFGLIGKDGKMNFNEFQKTLNCVDVNQKYKGKGYLIEYLGVKVLTKSELESMLNKLANFDFNNLWNKKYMKVGIDESICAVARPLQDKLMYVLRDGGKIDF